MKLGATFGQISVAILDIQEALGSVGVDLPPNFLETIYFSQTPQADLAELISLIKNNSSIGKEFKACLVVNSLMNVHRQWIFDNRDNFGLPVYREQHFLFLRAEYIGWDELMKNYVFMEPILRLLELEPSFDLAEHYYDIFQENLYCEPDFLTELIRLDLKEYDKDISEREVKKVVKQVLERCPALR